MAKQSKDNLFELRTLAQIFQVSDFEIIFCRLVDIISSHLFIYILL